MHEHVSPRHLADVEEVGEASLERVGDDGIGSVKSVVCAIQSEERGRAPEPGQELVEPVGIRDAVAKNRLELLECLREAPADVIETAFAQREWEPGSWVEVTAGSFRLRQGSLRFVDPSAGDEIVGQLGHVRDAQIRG